MAIDKITVTDNNNAHQTSHEKLFRETEIQANRLGVAVLRVTAILLVIIIILTKMGVFLLGLDGVLMPSVQGIVIAVTIIIITRFVKPDTKWLKYLLLTGIVLVYARLDMMFTHKAAILMVLPIVFSSRYFSKKLTIFTAILSVISFFISAYVGATTGLIDINIVTMPAGTVFTATGGFLGDAVKNAGVSDEMLRHNTLLFNYIPKWLMFTIAALISINIAERGHEMVVTQYEKDQASARIQTELSLANKIQSDSLPSIFPPYPERKEIDLYASMDPAKEVGGDFYDFFMVDDDNLALVMADVSGKGIPAALFMMVCKILIQNLALSGLKPSQVLMKANEQICMTNHEEMFVTVWLGILNLSTGHLIASNAGHEYPIIKKPDGDFEMHKDKHGFVIGGMDGVVYKDYELQLEPGSKLFVYTDGLPEANNIDNDLLGVERVVEHLNTIKDEDAETVLKDMANYVEEYSGEAEQFDDLTMMCLHYKGNKQ